MPRTMRNTTECAKSAVMLDGEIATDVDILQGVAQGCTLSPNSFKVYISGTIVAVAAARQGVTLGGLGLMFADDFVGISEAPDRLYKEIEKALFMEHNRKWRVTANVKKKCAVVVCNQEKVYPVTFKWTWGEAELPIADQCSYLFSGEI